MNDGCTAGRCVDVGFVPSSFGGTSHPIDLGSADLNGDGRLDLVVMSGSFGETAGVLLGRGDGSFDYLGAIDVGRVPLGLAIGDLNGDRRPDLVFGVANAGAVSVLLGNGDGTFAPHRLYLAGRSTRGIALGDQNHDGHLDVLAANLASDNVSLFLGNGDGTLRPRVDLETFVTRPVTVAMHDFNGDGFDDLAVQCNGVAPPGTGGFDAGATTVWLSDPKGGVRPPTSYPSDKSQSAVFTADVDQDGHFDLLVGGGKDASLMHWKGLPSGRFELVRSLPVPLSGELDVADMDGDGLADLVTPSGILTGSTGFNVAAIKPFAAGAPKLITGLRAADFNGDGRRDVAFSDLDGNAVVLLEGKGDGTLGPLAVGVAGGGTRTDLAMMTPAAVTTADLDGNGTAEILVASSASGSPPAPALLLFSADAKGVVRRTAQYGVGTLRNPGAVAAADFNNDKSPDVAVSDLADGSVQLMAGSANGKLGAAVRLPVPSPASSLAVADLDRDGNADLVATSQDIVGLYYLLGKGNGTFAAAVTLPVGQSPRRAAIADLDGDGNLDLIVATPGSQDVSVCLGKGRDMKGQLGFQPTVRLILPGMSKPSPAAISVAEIGGDALPDLVVADGLAFAVRAWVNTTPKGGALAFAMPVAGPTPFPPSDLVGADFNRDGRPDFAALESQGILGTLLGNAMQPLGPRIDTYLGGSTPALASGDLDGDGRPDLVTIDPRKNSLTALHNIF